MAASNDEDEEEAGTSAAPLRRYDDTMSYRNLPRRAQRRRVCVWSSARERANGRRCARTCSRSVLTAAYPFCTVRMYTKTALVGAYSPTYTPDIYRITGRELGAGSRRVVLYSLETVAALQSGEQAPCTIGTQRVRLPVTLTGCDRRWLMPLASDATPSFASRYPGARLAFNIIDPSALNAAGQAAGEDVEDVRTPG
jgi:hypothetical protein